MTGTYIVTTPRGEMHPLAFQGILVSECYSQIVDLVRARLGDSHVLLFAEPVFDADRESVDWYSPVQGQPRRLRELPEAEQAPLLAEFGRMGEEIRTAAVTLQKSGDPQRTTGGHILELALRYPDENCLYVVGGQPVMIGWGFGPATVGAQPQDISRRTAAPAAPEGPSRPVEPGGPRAAVPPQSPRQGAGWLLWLLPLVLLAVLLALLFVSWGGRPPLLPGLNMQGPALPFFPAPSASPDALLKEEQAKEGKLSRDVDGIRAELAKRAALCVKTPSPAAARSPETPLEIPEDAAKSGDVSFMEGVWRCDTGLKNTTTGTPVVVEYTFDDTGKGHISIFGDKGECRGTVQALLNTEGNLVLETQNEIVCPHGGSYSGQRVICTGRGGQAECKGRNLSRSGQTWDARFYRKQSR